MLEVPRHEMTVSPVVARKLELAYRCLNVSCILLKL